MSRREDKREQLLRIAVDMYSREGDFTARDLTARAGMNIASLNYYFGSKENLVGEIEQRLLQLFTEDITSVSAKGRTPLERLSTLLYAVAERLLANPGITRHFVDMLIAGDDRVFELLEASVGRGGPIFAALMDILRGIGITDEEEGFRRLVIGVSSLAPVFVIGLGRARDIPVLQHDAFVRSHIDTLANLLLAPLPAVSPGEP